MTLIFHHIPKAAGSTFTSSLAWRYPRSSVFQVSVKERNEERLEAIQAMSPKQRKDLRFVAGHMPLGAHRLLEQESRYYAFVREPVKRVLSLCGFIRQRPHHYLHEPFKRLNWDVAAFVKASPSTELSNEMVRYFCLPEQVEAGEEIGEMHLGRAIENVDQLFPSVGLSNRYDASVVVFTAHYGLFEPYYMRRNASGGRAEASVDASALAAVRAKNEWDLRFYEHLEKRFDQQLEALLAEKPNAVEAFRRKNQLYGQYLYAARAGLRKYLPVI